MGAYRVTSPYALLKVRDFNGQTVVQGYYTDGVVTDPIEDEVFDKHLRNGWLEEVSAPVSDEPVQEEPPADEVPKGNASREIWAAFAKDKKGAPEEETRPVEDGGLTQTALRDKYGN